MSLIINPQYKGNTVLTHFLQTLPQSFSRGGTSLWNKRNQIRRFRIQESDKEAAPLTVVVKKYKHPNIFQRIASLFSKGKARKAYLNGLELIRRGFLTPLPVACLEIRRFGILQRGYFVSEPIDWPPVAEDFDRPDWDKSLACAFAGFAAALHTAGVLHGDLNKTNVLFRKDPDGGFLFQLIDNNRMRFLPKGQLPSDKACMENLTRFTGNLELFSFVAREYAVARGLNADCWTRRAVAQKHRHDRRWRRRKMITHPIRTFRRMRASCN